jgi:hypothetical protein
MITPKRVIGIDPGSDVSGICMLKDTILHASNTPNSEVFETVKELCGGQPAAIVIEDIAPYNMRLKPQVIATCKFIGELSYRFRAAGLTDLHFVTRNEVKKWVFDTYPDICIPRIEEKIARLHKWRLNKGMKGFETKSGDLRSPTFVFVDDRIVIAAIKQHLDIPTPKPGKSNQYGLKAHSWQALAVACFQIGIFQKNE